MADPKSDASSEKVEEPAVETETAEDTIRGAEHAVELEAFDDLTADLDAGDEDERDIEIDRLATELAQVKDQLMRAAADLQNMRKRAERDRREAATYGGTKLARDVLGVYDNLTKALSLATDEMRETDSAFVEGLELTQRELLQAFGKHDISIVAPEKGEKFDPNFHQAMFEAPIGEPGAVVELVQPGFKIADRLLRPAMVGVGASGARPTAEADAADTEGSDAEPT